MFPNRVPMESDTLSPDPLVILFMSARFPKKGAFLQYGEKHTVTVHGAPLRWKAYMQWGAAWSPKGIDYGTAISTPVPFSPRHDILHLALGRPELRNFWVLGE